MDNRPNRDFSVDITDALAWWGEAGVDCDFLDEPVRWVIPEEEAEGGPGPASRIANRARAADPATPAPAVLNAENLPSDLPSFRNWWLEDPALEGGRTGGRVPPRGPINAPLMVLVPQPERGDRERLLSQESGSLVDAMLAAFGIGGEQAYIASVLPCYSPGFDWHGAEARKLAPVALRHITLAAPQRLLIMGFNILPLFGHELPQRPQILTSFKHESAEIPVLASRDLDYIRSRAGWKAALWREWLNWN